MYKHHLIFYSNKLVRPQVYGCLDYLSSEHSAFYTEHENSHFVTFNKTGVNFVKK